MTEREKLIARFEQKRANGLIDTKFFVRSHDQFTVDDFIAQANRIDDLVEAGDCRRHENFDEAFEQKDFSHVLR